MAAIGYCRVSTEEQNREGVSLEAQSAKIRAYCDLHDMELSEIVIDAGKSGKDLNRDGIKRVLTLISEKKIDAIVIYKIDRLSRKTKDVLNLMEQFEKSGIAFHSITERLDTKSAMGIFVLTMFSALAELERGQISERTIFALAYKKDIGQVYGEIPYGFHAENGLLIEDETEHEIIDAILDLRKQGWNYSKIAREMEIRGYQPKKGGKWYAQTIKNICNRFAA